MRPTRVDYSPRVRYDCLRKAMTLVESLVESMRRCRSLDSLVWSNPTITWFLEPHREETKRDEVQSYPFGIHSFPAHCYDAAGGLRWPGSDAGACRPNERSGSDQRSGSYHGPGSDNRSGAYHSADYGSDRCPY